MLFQKGTEKQTEILDEILLIVFSIGVCKSNIGVQRKHLRTIELKIIIWQSCRCQWCHQLHTLCPTSLWIAAINRSMGFHPTWTFLHNLAYDPPIRLINSLNVAYGGWGGEYWDSIRFTSNEQVVACTGTLGIQLKNLRGTNCFRVRTATHSNISLGGGGGGKITCFSCIIVKVKSVTNCSSY